jgi:hypothetical protein
MGKTRRYNKEDSRYENDRAAVLDQVRRDKRARREAGVDGIPPGFFHDTSEKSRRRKDRKEEKSKLRDMVDEYNQ